MPKSEHVMVWLAWLPASDERRDHLVMVTKSRKYVAEYEQSCIERKELVKIERWEMTAEEHAKLGAKWSDAVTKPKATKFQRRRIVAFLFGTEEDGE
jgi:hypothetical protein